MSNKPFFSDSVRKRLKGLFSAGRRPHALLIDGGEAEEGETLAMLAAQMLVCDGKDTLPCEECNQCRKAKEGIHPDIIGVEKPEDKKRFVKADLKNMVSEAYLTPNEARTKVYIIKELQLMSEECQNVLLKILEEPPSYTAFVLTSQNANAVIGTVISRVVRLTLGEACSQEYSEKAIGVVRALSNALLTPYEYDRIEAVAPLDGNKQLAAEVLDIMCTVFRDSIVLKLGAKAQSKEFVREATALSNGLGMEKLMDMYEKTHGLLLSLENNPNYTLLSAVLCANL